MNLTLKRIAYTNYGTFGVLKNNEGIPFAITLERKWLNNIKGTSCIPDGSYTCKRIESPKFGDTFEVTNVPNRSEILFHKGNLDDDSHGCILIGSEYGIVKSEPAIVASGAGFEEFMTLTKYVDTFELVVEA